MSLFELSCPFGSSENIKPHCTFTLRGQERQIYHCADCDNYFSETKNRPIEGLRTPLSRIIRILDSLNEGMGINATCRVFNVSKNSIYRWMDRLAYNKNTDQRCSMLPIYSAGC